MPAAKPITAAAATAIFLKEAKLRDMVFPPWLVLQSEQRLCQEIKAVSNQCFTEIAA
jgi:hypothetical protein